MDQTQVDPLEGVVLDQSLDVLVGPPNHFFEFPTGFFGVDFKLLSLCFIKPLGGLQVPADVLISEQFSRLSLAMSRSGSATARRISGKVASARVVPPLDSKRTTVATFWCSRCFLISFAASRSSLMAWASFLPAMSVVTGPSRSLLPSCSNIAARK